MSDLTRFEMVTNGDRVMLANPEGTYVEYEKHHEQIEQLQATLTELVRLKDLKDAGMGHSQHKDYTKNKPLAWDAARKVLGVDQNGTI